MGGVCNLNPEKERPTLLRHRSGFFGGVAGNIRFRIDCGLVLGFEVFYPSSLRTCFSGFRLSAPAKLLGFGASPWLSCCLQVPFQASIGRALYRVFKSYHAHTYINFSVTRTRQQTDIHTHILSCFLSFIHAHMHADMHACMFASIHTFIERGVASLLVAVYTLLQRIRGFQST